jgi:hypothetical protein
MSDDIVGSDKIESHGGMSASDLIAAKFRAKADEDQADAELKQAAARAVESSRGNVSITETEGGVTISGSGTVKVGGSIAGRDLEGGNVTRTKTSTYGLSAADVAKLFDSIYARIGQQPAEDRPDIQKAVDTIKAAATQEAVAGEKPNEDAVKAASQALAVNAPDLLTDMADVALATLANPASGVVTIIRKIAQKIKASRGAA